ncbi:MAG: membrane protein insertion efficiency factor YidD [Planctomycetia bacterium]|nr:membrane protein insertion efficiency factor YidD [Planctomycetia bacterium]
MLTVLTFIWCIPRNLSIFFVWIYQQTLSPFIGRQCRFHPSCSNYCILAMKKYGFCYGLLKTIWRILRCNPFCKGGEDFP